MVERIKSIALVILILISLVLSWFLIYYSPYTDHNAPLEYQTRLKFGEDLTIKDVLHPKEIIYHTGENEHFVLVNNNVYFRAMEQEITKWNFYDIYPIYRKINWQDMIENQKGVEINFGTGLSDSLLRELFLIPPNTTLENVNRVWITSDEKENNTVAYFISDRLDKVYTSKTSVNNNMIEQYLIGTNDQETYTYYFSKSNRNNLSLVKPTFYLPNEGIEMNRIRKFYTPLSQDDFIHLLFIDPNMVRKVYEKDYKDHILYTDGSRSLQVYPRDQYISFYYHSHIDQRKNYDIEKDLYNAIRFVNQHGGFEGYYQVEKIEEHKELQQTILSFFQYIEGYPIIDYKGNYGEIRLKLSNGIVQYYQRAMILLDQSLDTKKVKTLNNVELLEVLQKKGISINQISLIELGYQVKRTKDFLELSPVWVVELLDNETIEIPALLSGV